MDRPAPSERRKKLGDSGTQKPRGSDQSQRTFTKLGRHLQTAGHGRTRIEQSQWALQHNVNTSKRSVLNSIPSKSSMMSSKQRSSSRNEVIASLFSRGPVRSFIEGFALRAFRHSSGQVCPSLAVTCFLVSLPRTHICRPGGFFLSNSNLVTPIQGSDSDLSPSTFQQSSVVAS